MIGEFIEKVREMGMEKKGRPVRVNPNIWYPSRAELEANQLLSSELGEYVDKLQKAAERGTKSVIELSSNVPKKFVDEAERIAYEVDKQNVMAFVEFSELKIGQRYFPTGSRSKIINTWKENFVSQCKTVKDDMKQKTATAISSGVLQGKNLNDVMKEIRATNEGMSRSKSELIARTEIGHLNSAIARKQQQSVGIEYYEWSASMDGRTRKSHALMDGKICRWDNPDTWYTFENGTPVDHSRSAEMFHGAPGEDFQCRCTALPYVPELEDDYIREKGEILGVVQTQ